MKPLILTIALLFALVVHAQDYSKTTRYKGGTNNIAATTTNSTPNTTWITFNEQLDVQASFKMLNAATGGSNVFMLDRAITTNLWETNYAYLNAICDGTNVVVRGTNIPTLGYPLWRVGQIRANSTNATTNLYLIAK